LLSVQLLNIYNPYKETLNMNEDYVSHKLFVLENVSRPFDF